MVRGRIDVVCCRTFFVVLPNHFEYNRSVPKQFDACPRSVSVVSSRRKPEQLCVQHTNGAPLMKPL